MGIKKLTEGVHLGIYKALEFGEEVDPDSAQRYRRYQIMKEMGWTFCEYQNTPAHIIAEIEAFMRTENKIQSEKLNG